MKCLIILFSIILMACANNAAVVKRDRTGYTIAIMQDTSGNSVLRAENDSLKSALFLAQFKINKVKKYLNICLKNPSQDKFLKGWIKRAIQ